MKNFTMVDNDILEADVSDGAVRLYITLSSYCFGDKSICFPSQNTLAAKLKKSVRTIQRYLVELISKGLIRKRRRGSISNEYEIVDKTNKNTVSKLKGFFKEKLKTHKTEAKFGKKASNFNAYDQRNYDYKKLEDMLLGNNRNMSYEDCLK
ncbi:helix-turn-helix domain-containing protein [Clostridium neuense]|uniref:Helix-turn-helix domain-containing protein n=1 Tax=Clostridium neuense TaxID=1728934 RepID=A0ABW8TCN8_9CLOT